MRTETELRQAESRLAVLFENLDVTEMDVVYTVLGIRMGIEFALQQASHNAEQVQLLIERGAMAAQALAELG